MRCGLGWVGSKNHPCIKWGPYPSTGTDSFGRGHTQAFPRSTHLTFSMSLARGQQRCGVVLPLLQQLVSGSVRGSERSPVPKRYSALYQLISRIVLVLSCLARPDAESRPAGYKFCFCFLFIYFICILNDFGETNYLKI